jgi:ribonuclease HI
LKASFKGKDVWAEVDEEGMPKVDGGRVPIRYSASAGAKIYRGGASGLDLVGKELEDLPAGESADDVKAAPAARPAARSGRGSGFGSAGDRTEAQAAAAKIDARSRIAALSPDTIQAFTDGACKGNPGPTGSGLVLKMPGRPNVERYKALGEATNNVGELTAIQMALEALDEFGVALSAPVVIFTDSDYSRGVLTLNWKPKANTTLIAAIKAAIKRRPGVKVEWLAGHVGVAENERADELAGKGSAESARRR